MIRAAWLVRAVFAAECEQCTPTRATARVPTPLPLYPRPYNDYGCMARMSSVRRRVGLSQSRRRCHAWLHGSYEQCTPARATARVPTTLPLYPRPYNDYGGTKFV